MDNQFTADAKNSHSMEIVKVEVTHGVKYSYPAMYLRMSLFHWIDLASGIMLI